MNQIHAMRVFVRVVDLGSFANAAKQMSLSPAAVTRSVSMLESQVKMRLLNRSTRSLSLTDAGRLYLDGCRQIIQKMDEVESNLTHASCDPSGVIRIAVPELFAAGEFSALLAAYRVNRRVAFDVTVYERHVNMIEGGFDVCLTTSNDTIGATLISRRLTSVRDIAVATPIYLTLRGTPSDPKALIHHDLLTVDNGLPGWAFVDKATNRRVLPENILSSASCAMVREAALAHMGIAFLPRSRVAEDLARGAFKEVLAGCDTGRAGQDISIVYSGRNRLSMKVRAFIDFATDYFRPVHDAGNLRIVA
jgi:DNA-binding transcriptional LysR family regulator